MCTRGPECQLRSFGAAGCVVPTDCDRKCGQTDTLEIAKEFHRCYEMKMKIIEQECSPDQLQMAQKLTVVASSDLENKMRPIKSVDPVNKNQNTKRTALDELGNKLHLRNDALGKKNGNMGPPVAAIKKVVHKEFVSRRNPKEALEKQESFASNTHQEIEAYSSKRLGIVDPDPSEQYNPLLIPIEKFSMLIPEYVTDIYNYLKELEDRYVIKENHLDKHCSKPHMRSYLVNWLVEVQEKFSLHLETLHLCVGIIDRYLQDNKHVGSDTLQLVGVSALFVASKFEEIYFHDFRYICDDTFTRKQIIQMERDILSKVQFELGRPCSINFSSKYNRLAKVTNEQHTLTLYILELALVEYKMAHVKPSIVAAAACCLSIALTKKFLDLSTVWDTTLKEYSGYDYSDFKTVVYDLAYILLKAKDSKYNASYKKYASSKFLKISQSPMLKEPLIKQIAAKSSYDVYLFN